ncbi:hypothetical protein AADR41_06110 [Streptomyces sp. CLV115]|uniref:hypothetical protein n=1 Tax=Streptomyces sp. CLV115 TaxID=3138502 RepID=UPI00313ABE6F
MPEDVRILATAQWEGRGHPFEQFGITILEPRAQHPLTDTSYLSEKERAEPDIMANCAASEQMAKHLKAVAQDEDGNFYGYWLHPQEQETTQPPLVIKVDTESAYWELCGLTFSEACLYDISFDNDELFVKVAAELAELGISIPVGSREDLAELSADPAPEDMHSRFFDAEREKLGPPS